MLTSDLIKVRRRSGKINPAYLQPSRVEALVPLAQSLIDTFASSVGRSMDELDEAVREVSESETDRQLVAGLVKLLRDRCEVATTSDFEPTELRAEVFGLAASRRRELSMRDSFDRDEIIASYAGSRDLSPAQLESMLFADLPGAQELKSVRPITPVQLMQRYNLALAQGVLFRATRLVVDLEPTTAPRVRQILRAIKFRRLMHRVEGTSRRGYRIVLDGPMSLFEATQRYGVQLALFLPVLVAGDGWRLEADLRWGKNRSPATFALTDRDGLTASVRHDPVELEEVTALVRSFRRLDAPWRVRRTSRIFDLGGRAVFVPDLVFEHVETKEKIYFEAFGYWNRDAVFQRVEALESELGERFILAASKKLRVSPDIVPEGFPGAILVYANVISAHTVRRMLDEVSGGADA